MFSPKEILDMAIRLEKNGERVYRDAIKRNPNSPLSSLLEWMAEEEVRHARWFDELRRSLEEENANPIMEEMNRELVQEMLGDQTFSLKEVDLASIEDPDVLVDRFIEFERDSILFYQMLQPFLKDETASQNLERIIAEESRHIEKLQEFIQSRKTAAV
jgi:rubrerythrin